MQTGNKNQSIIFVKANFEFEFKRIDTNWDNMAFKALNIVYG